MASLPAASIELKREFLTRDAGSGSGGPELGAENRELWAMLKLHDYSILEIWHNFSEESGFVARY
jgi:hypothetical protein